MNTPANQANVGKSAAEIVEETLTNVVWVSKDQAYCECPGAHLHTAKDGKRDCVVYLDAVPTIHCLHTSCSELVAKRNAELRKATAIASTGGLPKQSGAEAKLAAQERERLERLRKRAKMSLPRMLKDYSWPYQQIIGDSPVKIPEDRLEQTRLFLPHYPADGLIWIGGKYDSGNTDFAEHFKTRDEWLKQAFFGKSYICPSMFKADSHSRSNENVVAQPFLVVESDIHSKDQVGGIFKWLRDEVKMDLVAVVDTGGKSLHGWFSLPEQFDLTEAKLVLPALGCDPAMFTKSQPVRLPGGLREEKMSDGKVKLIDQTLIYLKKS